MCLDKTPNCMPSNGGDAHPVHTWLSSWKALYIHTYKLHASTCKPHFFCWLARLRSALCTWLALVIALQLSAQGIFADVHSPGALTV